ncbi:Ig-like domain-containing protein [Microbacterium sp. SLBN-146]|uniref:Ig-like domain-containing protein n=1 Tax=Microbacterium sp. SLBN-146 TaxID=2768457 RepID=UPI00114E9C93|nr:Ig-like domain-containing protein [Microbacterium sp. SLBN-146]TQJ30728.1 hypothetical protein FBY39_1185 [Microbacterium sp. SLBN-146]
MSTESSVRRRWSFLAVFVASVGALLLVAVLGAGASVAQGPRVTAVLADPVAAAGTSGSRVIFTANQPLAAVDAEQVTVDPIVPFTVDTSGRSVGVRFSEPLADGSRYTITIDGVSGLSGTATSRFETVVDTPPVEVYMLERSDSEDDRIYRAGFEDDERVTVFEHPRIEDFRQSPRGLVVSTTNDQGDSDLFIVPVDGREAVEVKLPGVGRLSRLQLSDSGDRIAYTWTDPAIEGLPARDSVVYLSSTASPEATPSRLDLGGADPRIDDFRFVQGTRSLLLITRGKDLLLADTVTGGEPTRLGQATLIDEVARDEPIAVVRTEEGPEEVDLRTGDRTPLAVDHPEYGRPFAAEKVVGRGILSTYLAIDEGGSLSRQTLVLANGSGSERLVADVPVSDAVIQVCAAPSGRFVAVTVAPDIATNTVDDAVLAMPREMVTRVIPLEDGDPRELPGFAISWCRGPAS